MNDIDLEQRLILLACAFEGAEPGSGHDSMLRTAIVDALFLLRRYRWRTSGYQR